MKHNRKPQNLSSNFQFLIKLSFFSLIFSWFLFNYYFKTNWYSDLFAIILSLTALLGAVYSFDRSRDWGFSKSLVGQSLLFIGFALLMWFIGQAFYFLDFKVLNPLNIYEFFFIFIDPFYLLGMYFLAKSIGTFKYLKANVSLITLPILLLILNFIIVSVINGKDLINMFTKFDVNDVYILGSIILTTFVISILIFSKKLGGIYKSALLYILFGIIFQFVGDNLFAFYSSEDVNGSFSDLLFFVSISLVTYGIFKLDPKKLNE